jgi:peptidoglycan/LPS O-acetylase OafA/YrhL
MLALHQQGPGALWRTDTQLAPIFLSAAAYLAFRDRQVPSWAPLVALGAAAASAAAPIPVAYLTMPACLAVAVATIDRAPARFLRALSVRPLAALGLCSYSIYLWQHPFYRLELRGMLPPWPALALGVAAGIVSFRYVEQPARRWLNRVWAAGRPGSARPPQATAPQGRSHAPARS